jgi:hypothetical protein
LGVVYRGRSETMELSEFIKDTLVGISKGIRDGNAVVKKALPREKSPTEYQASPFFQMGTAGKTRGEYGAGQIEFDIAVTVSKDREKKGGGKFGVQVVSLGAELTAKEASKDFTRIKFAVEVAKHVY